MSGFSQSADQKTKTEKNILKKLEQAHFWHFSLKDGLNFPLIDYLLQLQFISFQSWLDDQDTLNACCHFAKRHVKPEQTQLFIFSHLQVVQGMKQP